MPAYLECLSGLSIHGWAADYDDLAERFTITISVAGDPLFSVVSDRFRPDLASIGDGRYGFAIRPPLDLYVRIALAETLEIAATGTTNGRRLAVEHLPNALAALETARRPLDDSGVRIIGESFLADNVAAFGRNAPAVHAVRRSFASFKMEAFMSGPWVVGTAPHHDDPFDAWDARICSADHWLSQIGPQMVSSIRSGELMLLFDMSNEGIDFTHSLPCIDALHRGLAAIGLRPSDCVLLSQNTAFAESYRIWARRDGLTDLVHVLCYDYFPRRYVALNACEQVDGGRMALAAFDASLRQPRARRVLTLNFTPRAHRVALVAWMLAMGYRERAFISFKGFEMHKLDARENRIPDWFPRSTLLQRGMAELKAIGRLDLDLAETARDYTPEFGTGPLDLYAQSYVSIVTETEMMGPSIARITEKILKPMAAFHPFIVLGNPNSLDRLRRMGFRTFHPFIDETYDLMDGPMLRARLALKEIKRLMDMSEDEIAAWFAGLRDILIHNFKQLDRLDEMFRSEIEPALLRELADV